MKTTVFLCTIVCHSLLYHQLEEKSGWMQQKNPAFLKEVRQLGSSLDSGVQLVPRTNNLAVYILLAVEFAFSISELLSRSTDIQPTDRIAKQSFYIFTRLARLVSRCALTLLLFTMYFICEPPSRCSFHTLACLVLRTSKAAEPT
jgi:hypothetical protein